MAGAFVHGFTYSHQPVAAAVALEVLRILESESLVEASAAKGERLLGPCSSALGRQPGRRRRPWPRPAGRASSSCATARRASRSRGRRGWSRRWCRTARERGLLLYSGTGNANGVDGDTMLLGPPFVVTDDELVRIADGLAEAVEAGVAAVEGVARA